MNTALLLLPDFALILLGTAIRRWMHLSDHFWSGVEKLVYFILFPALLINAIVKTRLDLGSALPLLATAFAAMAGGMLLGIVPKLITRLPALTFASMFQCAYRFNSYIALAVAGMLFGSPGIATMGLVVGAAVPVVNLVSVWMLARHGEVGLLREVARNPLIWGTAAGFLLNLAGFVPPAPLQAFLGRLADASIALGLITVGAALRLDSTPGVRVFSAWLVLVKLLALPVVALLVGAQLGLSGLNYQIVVLFAALPTASSAYILAMRMGGDGKSVAWLISATTLGSMLTLPLWAAWLARPEASPDYFFAALELGLLAVSALVAAWAAASADCCICSRICCIICQGHIAASDSVELLSGWIVLWKKLGVGAGAGSASGVADIVLAASDAI